MKQKTSFENFGNIGPWMADISASAPVIFVESSHFESSVCKLESMSSHMKFQIFFTFFMLWNGAR